MSDNLTPGQRSRCMSRVRNKDTDIEIIVRSELHKRGFRFRKHLKQLPGTPDVVFTSAKVAVFIDGDFWHGYKFPSWKASVSPFWQNKISINRARDIKNFSQLRRKGWKVIRLWKHDLRKDLDKSVKLIVDSVLSRAHD